MLFLAQKDALFSLEGWKIHTEESALLQTNGRKKKKKCDSTATSKDRMGSQNFHHSQDETRHLNTPTPQGGSVSRDQVGSQDFNPCQVITSPPLFFHSVLEPGLPPSPSSNGPTPLPCWALSEGACEQAGCSPLLSNDKATPHLDVSASQMESSSETLQLLPASTV